VESNQYKGSFYFGIPGIVLGFAAVFLSLSWKANDFSMASLPPLDECEVLETQFLTLPSDSNDLIYPFEDQQYDFLTDEQDNPFSLNNPDIIEQNVEYDPETNSYIVTETIDGDDYREPSYMSFEEFMEYQQQQMIQDYWNVKSNSNSGANGSGGLLGGIGDIGKKLPGGEIPSIFGPGGVDIRPSGSIDLDFGFTKQIIDNPALPRNLRDQPANFLFDMNINMSVSGSVGDRLNISTDYNTKQTFNTENLVNLEYVGEEDHILQKLEAGDTNFILPTLLIPSSQSLLGIKSQLKFGIQRDRIQADCLTILI